MVFRQIVDRIKQITGLKQKEIAVQVFKDTEKNFTNKIKRNSINIPLLIEWATKNNIDIHWLMTGEKYKEDDKDILKSGSVLEITHRDIIEQFTNKEWARNINQKLVELERLDPSKRDVITAYLDGILTTLNTGTGDATPSYTGPERRKGERRADKRPIDHDDRRKKRRRDSAVNE